MTFSVFKTSGKHPVENERFISLAKIIDSS